MSNLFGSYFIKPTPAAFLRADKLCNGKMRELQKLRSHCLKLAFWPDEIDIDWDWIKSLETKRVGELRIDEHIAQQDNIRIIFFKANKIIPGDPMPRIWPLTVFQKKRDDFTGKEIAGFRAMRDIVVARWYSDIPGA